MRLRRLVADSLKRLVQLFHSAWRERFSPENWCLGVENGVFFGFWSHFGVFLVFLGRKTSTFSSFSVVASNLREGVEVLGITPHLLNVSGHRRRLVRRTVERLVRISAFMRGCAGLKLSEACARGAGGAIARDWSCS